MTKKTILAIILTLLLLSMAIGLFIFYSLKQTQEASVRPVAIDPELVKLVNIPWSKRGEDSTVESLSNYVDEIAEQLNNPNTPLEAKKILMLKKALMLGTTRTDSVAIDSMSEAASLLRSVDQFIPQNDTDLSLKNSVVPSYLLLLIVSCYSSALGDELPAPYNEEYDRLRQEGYAEKAAMILSYLKYGDEALHENFSNDRITIALRAYLASMYLYGFGGERPELDAEILQGLKEEVAKYPAAEAILMIGDFKGEIEPAMYYAFAYDFAHTYGDQSVTPEINEQINANYEAVFDMVETKIQADETGKSIVNLLNIVNYLDSLHRRFDYDTVDKVLVDRLIDMYIENTLHNKETKDLFGGYMLEGRTIIGEWMPVRQHLYQVAKRYPKLQDFMEQFAGIEL